MKHTPTPWIRPPWGVTGHRAAALVQAIEFKVGHWLFIGQERANKEEGYDLVALIPHGEDPEAIERAKADADFVVKAVNAHDRLLAVARDLARMRLLMATARTSDDYGDMRNELDRICNNAHDIIDELRSNEGVGEVPVPEAKF